jgi:hypothetical protein
MNTRRKVTVKLVYDWGKSVVTEGKEFRPAPTLYADGARR